MFEHVVKKSRFISESFDVKDKIEFEKELNDFRKKFPDARHIVYAYIVEDGRSAGSSDDGEPKGTAGKAIFNLLMLKKVSNKAVIVARYFGGKKLGAGGLIRAYVESAKNVI